MFVPWISLALPIQAGPTSQTVRAIDSLMAEVPDFSGVVLVGEGVNKTYHKAFGYRDFRTMAPMDTGCVFELASISKTFTATLVLRLVQEKKIGLDDPVEKYIDPFPYAGITVRHTESHFRSS
jgi:CubicO group peptidase (beta-lactamase class C family)